MKYGFVIDLADVRTIGDLAQEAEAAGWDGVFIADAISIQVEKKVLSFFDPWVILAIIAMRTERLRFGPFITPVPRRRPWKLASETNTIDHLSKGRLTLAVGLGAAEDDGGFCKVGEAMDLKVRAQRLDEGLAILAGLWRGKQFSFTGEHYDVKKMTMRPRTVQSPRIPVWVVGVWPKTKSMRRALQWDGIIPQHYRAGMSKIEPSDVQAIRAYITENRSATSPFDIVIGGTTPGKSRKRATGIVRPYAEAGATWWMESSMTLSDDKLRERINQGPPSLE